MQSVSIGRIRSLAAKKSTAGVKTLYVNGAPIRPALTLSKRRTATSFKSSLPLRLRGSRYLKLSASATATQQSALNQPRVHEERFPTGEPVPASFEKIKVLNPADLKKNGRIIVVGDVHGCYDEFCSLLEACSYDPERDNLIMAGDLVNKGPDSLKVLKKAMKLKAVVVRGNHEDNALVAYYDHCRGDEIAEKYEWVKGLKKKHVAWLESLPFAVRIPSHKLIVVHAGLVPGTPLEEQNMFAMYKMRDLRQNTQAKAWVPLERGIEESVPWASQWQGPEHVIFGHDSTRRLQNHTFATGIDTGAVQGDTLSACVLPPQIPVPYGPATYDNLGIQHVGYNVDGPKKIRIPKSPEELSKILLSSVTATDNLRLDMYKSFDDDVKELVGER